MSLPKLDWIERCATRYGSRAGMPRGEALDMAENTLQCEIESYGLEQAMKNSPEEAADNDMDCWDDDGASDE